MKTGIPVFFIPLKLKMINDLILFWINQNLNLTDLLIFMKTMFTVILSKIPSFNILMLITMMRIITLQLTVVFSMQLPFRLIRTILSHLESFTCHNATFNLKNATIIHSAPYLVGYLLTSLNGHFHPPPSILVCQWVWFLTTTKYACIPMSSIYQKVL